MFQFNLGMIEQRPGSSVWYYQIQEKGFSGCSRSLETNAQGFALTKFGLLGQIRCFFNKKANFFVIFTI